MSIIHKNFANKPFICELKNTIVLLEDAKEMPWIMLVYKKEAQNMLSLTTNERLNLMKEIEICEKAMFKAFNPFHTNVAMLGNKTPWLHVHIICRNKEDACWPEQPFSFKTCPYTEAEKTDVILKIQHHISFFKTNAF